MLTMLLIAVGIVGFEAGAYREFQELFLGKSAPSHNATHNNSSTTDITVNTIFNYGNNTSLWFNHTTVSKGLNFYNLTLRLALGRIDALYSSEYSEHQILGINGVEQNATHYWSIWKFCTAYHGWALTPVGADEIMLSNNGIYGWYYQKQTGTQYPPVAGANAVTVLDINSC